MNKDNSGHFIGLFFSLVGAIITITIGMRSDAKDNSLLEKGLHANGVVQSIRHSPLRYNTDCYHPVVTFTDDSNTVMTVQEDLSCASKNQYRVGETVTVAYDQNDSTYILVNGHKSNFYVVWYFFGAIFIYFTISLAIDIYSMRS